MTLFQGMNRNIIDKVREQADIVEVVSDFVTLKRSGANYKGLSPFTNEKTPSFYVVPGKSIFKDFSSGKGGDVFTFLMEHEGVGFNEAVEILAKRYHIEVPEKVDKPADTARESLAITLAWAAKYFEQQLNEEVSPEGIAYWLERGINKRTIASFGLGFAPEGWDILLKRAIKEGHSKDNLLRSGLIKERDNSPGTYYDFFRKRVIVPIHGLSGRVIAFGGRVMASKPGKDEAKYINSPETDLYKKSEVLYGLFQAKNSIRKKDFCFLVEGYTDVISMHQSGIENTISSSGTALTHGQISLIRRFTNNVVIVFDADAAGQSATIRGLDLMLREGVNVKVCLLPKGEDPDSMIKKNGSTKTEEYLETNSVGFVQYKIKAAGELLDVDPAKKAQLIKEIISLIAVMPDSISQAVYLQECSKLLGIEYSALTSALKKELLSTRKNSTVLAEIKDFSKEFINPVDPLLGYEREIIRILLQMGTAKMEEGIPVSDYMFSELEGIDFIDPVSIEVFTLYKECTDDTGSFNESEFYKRLSPTAKQFIAGILVGDRYIISEKWDLKSEEDITKIVFQAIAQIKLGVIAKMIQEVVGKIKTESDYDKQLELMEIQNSLMDYNKELAVRSGRNIVSTSFLHQQ